MNKKVVTVKTAKTASRAETVIVLFMCVMIALFMAVMLYGSYSQDQKRKQLAERCTADVTAEVVKIDSEEKTERRSTKSHGKTRTYTHRYTQYTYHMDYTVDGNTYRTTETGRDTLLYSEGDKLGIKYDPDDPAVCYIKRSNDGKAFKGALIAAAVCAAALLFIAGSAISKFGKRRRNSANAAAQNYDGWQ